MKLVIEKLMPYADSFEEDFQERFLNSKQNKTQLLTKYPTVYIHNWKLNGKDKYDVYVGETNDIYQRTKQHIDKSTIDNTWQKESKDNNDVLYVIGHDHFNKSLTLDIENKFMEYMSSVDNVNKVRNLKGNPQNKYYPCEELDEIFSSIWNKLVEINPILFTSEKELKEKAIFKASPLKKLTDSQLRAKNLIIERVIESFKNKNDNNHKLIFIEGTAGTGKTVLTSSTFYELFCMDQDKNSELHSYSNGNLKSCLIVNHDQQENVYNQICKKLDIRKDVPLVYGPTEFLNKHHKDNPIDIAFIDEGHLLLTQNSQAFSGKHYGQLQLEEIMKRSKITVIMFDQNQVLRSQQYWDQGIIDKYKDLAYKEGNYIILDEQLRMHITNDKDVEKWIDDFTLNGVVSDIPKTNDYEIKIFDNPVDLKLALKAKTNEIDNKLSRLVATYDWEYKQASEKQNGEMWFVDIDEFNFHEPWNYELCRNMPPNQKKAIKDLAWSEQPQTINEIGSTFSIQGFDLSYVGVILGPSVTYRNNQIIYDPSKTKNPAVTKRTLENGEIIDSRNQLLKNEVRVLMTRGVNGLYIFACDKELRKVLLKASGKHE